MAVDHVDSLSTEAQAIVRVPCRAVLAHGRMRIARQVNRVLIVGRIAATTRSGTTLLHVVIRAAGEQAEKAVKAACSRQVVRM